MTLWDNTSVLIPVVAFAFSVGCSGQSAEKGAVNSSGKSVEKGVEKGRVDRGAKPPEQGWEKATVDRREQSAAKVEAESDVINNPDLEEIQEAHQWLTDSHELLIRIMDTSIKGHISGLRGNDWRGIDDDLSILSQRLSDISDRRLRNPLRAVDQVIRRYCRTVQEEDPTPAVIKSFEEPLKKRYNEAYTVLRKYTVAIKAQVPPTKP